MQRASNQGLSLCIQKIEKTVEVPQVQFIDKDTVGVPVVFQRQVPVIQKEQRSVEVPQFLYIGRIVDVPVVLQREVPTNQRVQKTVEVLETQHLDEVLDVPVVMQLQIPLNQRVQRTVEIRQVRFVDRIVDVFDDVQRQVPMAVDASSRYVPVERQRQAPKKVPKSAETPHARLNATPDSKCPVGEVVFLHCRHVQDTEVLKIG